MKGHLLLIPLLTLFFSCASAQTSLIVDNDRIDGVPEFPKTISMEDKLYTLSIIWSEIKYNFVNIDRIDFDADSLYKETIPSILASLNDIEYYNILERFICSFGDGHTQLLGESYNWNEYFDYIPCAVSEFNGEFYFTSTRKNSGIDSTLLGAKIIEIEGDPVLQYIEKKYFPYIASSTYEHKLFLAKSKIGQGIKLTYFNGKALKRDGTLVDFSIQRNGETYRTKNDQYWELKKTNRGRAGAIHLDWNNNIAILKINTFREQVIPEMDSLMNIISNRAEGLIIDLRRNGGGSTETAWQLQKYLTKGDSFLSFGSQTRINNGYGKSQGNYRKEYEDFYLGQAYTSFPQDTIYVEKSLNRIECPVVILIGIYSYSACEDFLVNIYELPDRPFLIGEKTAGSTGAPLVLYNLPNEPLARISTLRILFPLSMNPFVNMGIVPDIEIKESFEDYLQFEDVVLDKALQVLKSK